MIARPGVDRFAGTLSFDTKRPIGSKHFMALFRIIECVRFYITPFFHVYITGKILHNSSLYITAKMLHSRFYITLYTILYNRILLDSGKDVFLRHYYARNLYQN